MSNSIPKCLQLHSITLSPKKSHSNVQNKCKTGRPSIVNHSDINILKSILYKNSNLSETQIHKEWNRQIGKTLSRSTCRRNLKKLKLSCTGFSTNEEQLDNNLTNSKSSLTISGKNEQQQKQEQQLKWKSSSTQIHNPYKRRLENRESFETNHLQHDIRESPASSSFSLGGMPSNLCEIQLDSSPSSNRNKFRQSTISPSFSNEITNQRRNSDLLLLENDMISNYEKSLHRNKHKKNENHKIKSREVLSNSSDLLQKENHDNSNSNLKTFGEFIDVELQKLDKNSQAIAKMKINEILHEATVGMYKNMDIKIDSVNSNHNLNYIINDSNDDDSDNEIEDKSADNQKRQHENDKENRIPSNHVPRSRYQGIRNDNFNSNCETSKNISRKKRLKSKDLLTVVYDTLRAENDRNINDEQITFGMYVYNELKNMDKMTIANAKLNICRILYEASIGKYKNSINEFIDMNEQNTQLHQQQTVDVQQTSEQGSDSIDLNYELISPKMEISDSSYDI